MSQPQQDALSVIAGADLEEIYFVWDNDTGLWAEWLETSWEAEMTIRDHRGTQVARIANFGIRDGEIALIAGGQLKVTLPAAVTATLPLTRVYTNSTDPRVVSFRHRGVLFFDLIVTETISGDVSDLVNGTVTVHQAVS